MTKTNYEMVKEFHEKFGCEIGDTPKLPCEISLKLRKKLVKEEYTELLDAIDEGNLHNVAKEMVDLLYVVYGMGVTFGIPIDKCFEEVHRSNMSKLGPDGKPIVREDGKVLKPDTYSPANLRSILGLE